MSTPTITLGGITLGGSSSFAWDMVYGCRPSEQVYTLTDSRAVDVPLGKSLTLSIDGVRKPLKVDHVYALEVGAGVMPQQRTLILADRRWLWPRKRVASSFNVRRATGERTLQTEAGQPIEIAQLEPIIRYAKWSLYPKENGSQPWTALQVLDEVFQQLEQPYRIADAIPEVEVQDLELDDDGASALERVLAYLPGADVFIDLDGTAVVRNVLNLPITNATRTRENSAVLPALARKQVIGSDIVVSNRKAVRPAKVVVYFTPEVELRLDSVAEGGTRTRDSRSLINVAPSPDLTLTLSNGDVVARGSYVALETLFSTWGAFGILGEALTTSLMAELGYASNYLEQLYVRGDDLVFDPVDASRAATAAQHWRRTYQVDELFMQRVSSISATRVAVLNPSTGLRARSEAYCDFTRRPNTKNPAIKGMIERADYGWCVRGYATILADAKAAPATVSVVDPQAGILRIEPQVDPWGLAEAVMLGYPSGGTIPLHDGDAEANRTGLDSLAQWAACRMTTDFQVATVVTVVPASPNDTRKFWKVEIGAGEVGKDGDGPTVHARVFPGVMPARFAWNDAQADQITLAITQGSPLPEQLMVNATDVRAVAEATAKAIYAQYADIPVTTSGPVSVDMDPDIRPVGVLGSVRHGLNGGVTTTQVASTGIRRPVDIWPFLNSSTRRAVLKVLNQGAG